MPERDAPDRRKAQLSPNVTRLVVEAPRIAEIRQPGQFVIVRRGPGAERIPLTIADVDRAGRHDHAGDPGDRQEHPRADLAPRRRRHHGHRGAARQSHCTCSTAATPSASAAAWARPSSTRSPRRWPRNGVKVTSIIGGRSREWVIYEEELRAAGEVIVCTDDGSYGRHGFVTEALKDLCEAGGIDEVFAVGPVPMMRACSELTRPYGDQDDRLAQLDHDRRDGHVRRLPRRDRRQDASTRAATALSSTATRSTSACWPTD